METSEKAVIFSIAIGLVAGLAVSCALTANADPGYPHSPIVVETVEPIDISALDPIEITSELLASPEEVVIIEESAEFQPTTEAPTIAMTEPQPVIEETIAATEPPEPEKELYLTDAEKQMMAQLVHSEAGGESYKVKRLVADVVFNRVASPKWPNTIEEVIYQKGQFSVIRNGSFDRAAAHLEENDWLAVDEETYRRLDYGILYFNDDSIGGCANGKGGWKVGHMWFAY